jgi:hypothetical protein
MKTQVKFDRVYKEYDVFFYSLADFDWVHSETFATEEEAVKYAIDLSKEPEEGRMFENGKEIIQEARDIKIRDN